MRSGVLTRYTMVVHRDGARTAEQAKVAITGRFSELPVHLRLSLMWDQGIEMARQHELRKCWSLSAGLPSDEPRDAPTRP